MEMIVTIAPAHALRLEAIAKETGRKIENLVAAAAEEMAVSYFTGRDDDPSTKPAKQ